MEFLPICRKIKCPYCNNKEMRQTSPGDTGGYEVECPVCRTRSKMTANGYIMYSYKLINK